MIYVCVSLVFLLVGFALGAYFIIYLSRGKIGDLYELSEKYREMTEILSLWMEFIECGNSIAEKLKAAGIEKIAIYGIGFLGKRLFAQLKDSDVKILYIVDQNSGSMYCNVPVVSLSKDIEQVDAIIITPVYYYYAIKKNIEYAVNCRILSIDDIIRDGDLNDME